MGKLSIPIALVTLLLAYGLALGWLYLLVKMAPVLPPLDKSQLSSDNQTSDSSLSSSDDDSLELSFPRTLPELKRLASVLSRFAKTNPNYVMVLFCSAYIFKQTFAIPGSFLMNLLGGALYGTWFAFPLCSLLTATGATLCFLLSKLVGASLVERFFQTKLSILQSRINRSQSSNLFMVLITFRLFPLTPNWLINISLPHLQISTSLFFVTVLLGLMPYNFICVQTGSTLAQIESLQDVVLIGKMLPLLAAVAGTMALKYLIGKYFDGSGPSSSPVTTNKKTQ